MTKSNHSENSKSEILVIVLGFSIIGLLANNHLIMWGAVAVGVLSIASKLFERWLLFAWHKVSEGMGWIMSRLLLGAVFYLVLVPLSALKRLSGSKDALQLKKPGGTNWITRDHQYQKDDLIESF